MLPNPEPNLEKTEQNNSGNIYKIGFVSMFNDISSEMIYPLVPIFLTATLGVPVSIVGIIEGIAESMTSILKTFFGYWSDRLGVRKPFLISGYTFSAVSKVFLAISNSWGLVLFSRIFDKFGKGLRTSARDALIADSAQSGKVGEAFGIHRSLDTWGGVIGPIIGLGLLTVIPSDKFPLIFLLSVIPSIFGIILLFRVKEVIKQNIPSQETNFGSQEINSVVTNKAINKSSSLSILATFKSLPNQFNWFLLSSAIFTIANSSDTFLILRSKELGLNNFMVVALFALFNLVYAILGKYFGKLSDRIGTKTLLTTGFLLFSIIYFGFGSITAPIFLIPLFCLYGIYMAMTEGVSKSFINSFTTADNKATVFGFQQSVVGVFTLFSSITAGVLWDKFGSGSTFFLSGILSLVALTIFYFKVVNGKKAV